jgi:acetoin utilization protein AcuB
MYVGRVMHRELITVTPDTPLVRARKLIAEKRINHLLVIDAGGDLVGILSDRDIRQSWASPATSLSTHELNYLLDQITVEMVMIRKIVTISPDTTIERAARIMQENRIGALPVVENGKARGIITSTDVLGVLLEAIGIDRGETARFVVLVDWDRIGLVADIARILKEKTVNIRSLFCWPDRDHRGVAHIVLRVAAEDGDKSIAALRDGGYTVLTDYVPDLTPHLPPGLGG